MIVNGSLLVIAVAFVVLVIALVRTLKQVRTTAAAADSVLGELRPRLEQISAQSGELLQSAQQLSEDLRHKLDKLQPLIDTAGSFGEAAKEMGGSVRQATGSVRQLSSAVTRSAKEMERAVNRHHQQVADALEWAAAGMQLYHRWQDARERKQAAASDTAVKGEVHHAES